MAPMIVVLAVALLQRGRAATFQIGSGKVAVAYDDTSKESNGTGSILEIRSGRVTVARVSMRSLIEGWLKSDSFWGGHSEANQMRYADNPTNSAYKRLQGRVYEVVPAPGGCLVRMGLIDTSPSAVRVNQDLVMRWSVSRPNQWAVLDRSLAGSMFGETTTKLPRIRGVQFLVSGSSVYRLSGAGLRRNLVASFPPNTYAGWVGIKIVGSRLVLKLPDLGGEAQYRILDLATGRTTRPELTALRAMGIPVYIPPPEVDLPGRLGGSLPAVTHHSQADWERYIRVAGQRDASDSNRVVALSNFMFLVAPFGHGPWTAGAIRATRDAIRTGSYLVQLAGVRAVRAWIFHWPRQVRSWSPLEISLVREILGDATFRRVVYDRAKAGDSGISSGEEDAGIEFGPVWSTFRIGAYPDENSNPAGNTQRILLATYIPTLAISRSPLALPFLKAQIAKEEFVREVHVESLGYLPPKQIDGYLYGLAKRFYHPKHLGSVGNDYEGRQAFTSIVVALARSGASSFSPLVEMTKDRRIDHRTRAAMMDALSFFADSEVRQRLVQAALDATEPLELRREAIFDLPRCPGPDAKRLAQEVEKALPSGELKSYARTTLAQWSIRDGPRMRARWGIER